MAYIELGEVCEVTKGETGITKAISGEYPMVTTAENRISHNSYQLDTKAVLVPLVSATGHGHASIKRVHYQEGKFAFGSILAACVPKDDSYSAKFLHIYFLLMKDYVLVPLMKGSANVSLTLGNLKKAQVPKIPRKVQDSIVELYSKLKVEQDQTIDALSSQRIDIDKLRQAILQEAVQGKLTAQWREANPSVEDASELLNRIEAEKQLLIAEKKIKKEKPLPPIEDEDKPYELPERWVWCRLGEINYDLHYGYTASAKSTHEGIGLLRITDIQNNKVDWSSVPDCDITEKDLPRHLLKENDILIARTGGTIGKSYIVKNIDRKSVFASYLIRAIPVNAMSPDYMKVFIESPLYWVQLTAGSKGTGQPNVNATTLKNLITPVPPIDEQQAIVEKVNSLMALCDELEQQIDNSQTQIEQLMQSCLKEVFEVKDETV